MTMIEGSTPNQSCAPHTLVDLFSPNPLQQLFQPQTKLVRKEKDQGSFLSHDDLFHVQHDTLTKSRLSELVQEIGNRDPASVFEWPSSKRETSPIEYPQDIDFLDELPDLAPVKHDSHLEGDSIIHQLTSHPQDASFLDLSHQNLSSLTDESWSPQTVKVNL